MLIGLLIRRGSILKAKLRIAKRLSKARAVTIIVKSIYNSKRIIIIK
jgi:hypothetical protein